MADYNLTYEEYIGFIEGYDNLWLNWKRYVSLYNNFFQAIQNAQKEHNYTELSFETIPDISSDSTVPHLMGVIGTKIENSIITPDWLNNIFDKYHKINTYANKAVSIINNNIAKLMRKNSFEEGFNLGLIGTAETKFQYGGELSETTLRFLISWKKYFEDEQVEEKLNSLKQWFIDECEYNYSPEKLFGNITLTENGFALENQTRYEPQVNYVSFYINSGVSNKNFISKNFNLDYYLQEKDLYKIKIFNYSGDIKISNKYDANNDYWDPISDDRILNSKNFNLQNEVLLCLNTNLTESLFQVNLEPYNDKKLNVISTYSTEWQEFNLNSYPIKIGMNLSINCLNNIDLYNSFALYWNKYNSSIGSVMFLMGGEYGYHKDINDGYDLIQQINIGEIYVKYRLFNSTEEL